MCSYLLNLDKYKPLPHPCLIESGSCMAKLCAIVSYLTPFSSTLQDERGSGEYSTTFWDFGHTLIG